MIKSFLTFMSLILLLCAVPTKSDAQLLRKIKKRVSRTVEDAILDKSEEKARQKTDEALDEVLDEKQKKPKSKSKEESKGESSSGEVSSDEYEAGEDFMAAIMNRKEAVLKPSYSFHSTIEMQVDIHQRKKTKSSNTILSVGEGCFSVDYPEEDAIFIQDFENNSMITLDKKSNSGSAMSLDFMTKFQPKVKDSNEKLDIKKTGRTKKILGYQCVEYRADQEKGHTLYWITDEAPVNTIDIFRDMAKMGQKSEFMVPEEMNGLIMAAETYENDKLEYSMLVTKVNQSISKIDLSNYEISKM